MTEQTKQKKAKNMLFSGYFPVPIPRKVVSDLMTWASDEVSKVGGEGQLIRAVGPDGLPAKGGVYGYPDDTIRTYVIPLEVLGVVYLVKYSHTLENGCMIDDICQGVK